MSTALLALALLIALGITVFLVALGLTGLGTLLSRVFPVTPFEGALIHLVLFSLTIFLIGLTLLFERIKDSLWTTSAEDGEPLDEMLDVLKHDRNNADADKQLPFRREIVKVGRNDPCPCGSGKKYKFCCLNKV
jgi:hypothetical protein